MEGSCADLCLKMLACEMLFAPSEDALRKLFLWLTGCVVSRNYLEFKAVRSGGNTSRASKLHRFSRGRGSVRSLTRA